MGIISNFLNPVETITAEKYFQESIKCTQNCNVLHLTLVNRKGPIIIHDNTWARVLQIMLNEPVDETLLHPD